MVGAASPQPPPCQGRPDLSLPLYPHTDCLTLLSFEAMLLWGAAPPWFLLSLKASQANSQPRWECQVLEVGRRCRAWQGLQPLIVKKCEVWISRRNEPGRKPFAQSKAPNCDIEEEWKPVEEALLLREGRDLLPCCDQPVTCHNVITDRIVFSNQAQVLYFWISLIFYQHTRVPTKNSKKSVQNWNLDIFHIIPKPCNIKTFLYSWSRWWWQNQF